MDYFSTPPVEKVVSNFGVFHRLVFPCGKNSTYSTGFPQLFHRFSTGWLTQDVKNNTYLFQTLRLCDTGIAA